MHPALVQLHAGGADEMILAAVVFAGIVVVGLATLRRRTDEDNGEEQR